METMPGFGRRISGDPRDNQFPMRRAVDRFDPAMLPNYRHYYLGNRLPLNQGATGTCVAHAWTAFLMAAPLTCQTTPLTPFDLYRKIVLADEWTDNDYEATAPMSGLQSGTSVRAGAKVLQEAKHLVSYVWGQSADEVGRFILSGQGGVVMGTEWYDSMMEPNSMGLVTVDRNRSAMGGHAWFVYGYNRVTRLFRAVNSWGVTYGQRGRFTVTYDDMDYLIRRDGEACAAVEQRING